MSVDLFRKIIDEVSPMTSLVTFHLMGEPLLHPRLADLVEICHAKSVKIFLVTNGVLLREKESVLLLHPAFHQINFSLHSFPDNFGGEDIDAYLGRIFAFTERAFLERPELYLNYRLWNLEAPQAKSAINREILGKIYARFQEKLPSEWDVRARKSYRIKNRLSLHFDTEFTWPALNLPVLGTRGTCYGLSSHFGILVDGTVVPCCLDKEAAIPLGNIKELPLTEILSRPRAQKILTGFKKNQLLEELCQKCQYIERFKVPSYNLKTETALL